MRRFLPLFTLVFVLLLTISPPVHAQPVTILLSSDFESALTPWQGKYLLPDDLLTCKADNCFFQWSKVVTAQRRTLQTKLIYAGQPGDLVQFTIRLKMNVGRIALQFKLLNEAGQKVHCERLVETPGQGWMEMNCGAYAGGAYSALRLKLSTTGGTRIRVDDVLISVN